MNQIKNYLNGNTIAEGEEPIKELAEKNSTNLQGADLWVADLRLADLQDADLEAADLERADLWRANLWMANLRSANLRSANLRSANLRSANLRGAKLWSTDLWGANLWGADLRDTDLQGADLRSTDLRLANLQGAELDSTDLQGAELRGAKIKFPWFPPISLFMSMTLRRLPNKLILELMRRDAYAHPKPELFEEWAKGGECPFQGEQRTWRFSESRELWRKGKPQMHDSDLVIEICKSQGWRIRGYLE